MVMITVPVVGVRRCCLQLQQQQRCLQVVVGSVIRNTCNHSCRYVHSSSSASWHTTHDCTHVARTRRRGRRWLLQQCTIASTCSADVPSSRCVRTTPATIITTTTATIPAVSVSTLTSFSFLSTCTSLSSTTTTTIEAADARDGNDDDDDVAGYVVSKRENRHNSTNKEKKHSWTYEELLRRTEYLIHVVQGGGDKGTGDNVNITITADDDRTITSTQTTPEPPPLVFVDDCFNAIEAWMEHAKAPDHTNSRRIHAARQAESLLLAMEQNLFPLTSEKKKAKKTKTKRSSSSSSPLTPIPPSTVLVPNAAFYSVVLHAYACCNGGTEAAMAAHALLRHMLQHCRRVAAAFCNNAIMNPNRNSKASTSTNRMVVMMMHYPEPSIKCYNAVMNAWAKSGSPDAGMQAENVVQLMSEWRRECRQYHQAQRKAQLQQQQQFVHRNDNLQSQRDNYNYYYRNFPYWGHRVTEFTLSTLFVALSRSSNSSNSSGSRRADAPDRALAILHAVLDSKQQPPPPPPIQEFYHNNDNVNEDHDEEEDPFADVQLDITMFNTVIMAWARSGRGRDAAIKAESILEMILSAHHHHFHANGNYYQNTMIPEPSAQTFSLIIDAWSRCSEAILVSEGAARIHTMLERMIQLYRQGVPIRLDMITFSTALLVWARCAASKMKIQPQLSNEANMVYNAPDKAEQIMGWLLALYEETANPRLKPDARCWNQLLMAWSHAIQRRESMDQCDYVVQRMQAHHCEPNLYTYRGLLFSAARRGLGDKALNILDQMQSVTKPLLTPDARCYHEILKALGQEPRSDALERTQAFFDEHKFHLDVYAYTSFMGILSSRGSNDDRDANNKADRAFALLEDAHERYTKGGEARLMPDALLVCGAIKACTATSGSDEDKWKALQIALNIMQQCKSRYGVEPNNFVVLRILDAIDRLASGKYRPKHCELVQSVDDEVKANKSLSGIVRDYKENQARMAYPFIPVNKK